MAGLPVKNFTNVGPDQINSLQDGGQHAMIDSHPVVVASDQTPIPVLLSDDSLFKNPTLNAGAYSNGNVVGGQQTWAIFKAAANASGFINQFWMASNSGIAIPHTVYIFNAPPASSTVADHGAMSLNVADISKLVTPPFVLTPAVIGSGASTRSFALANIPGFSVKNKEGSPTVNVYVVVVVNGTITYPALDLFFGMSFSAN